MWKHIATWLANIIKTELAAVEKDVAGLVPHVSTEVSLLRSEIAELKTALLAHAENVRIDAESMKAHVIDQVGAGMVKRYDQIVDDAHRAATAAVHEARKTLRLPCSLCGQLAWKFNISAIERKPVCLDCEARGKS